MTIETDKLLALDEALRQIPHQAEPERDLWPMIEARLATPKPTNSLWRFAAAAALLAGVGLVVVNVMSVPAPVAANADLRTTPLPSAQLSPVPLPVLRPTAELTSFPGESYGEVRQAQIDQLEIQLQRLPEAERLVVAENLHTIRQAIDDIDSALADNPDSALLRELLRSSYQQELTTINRVNRLAVSMRDDL